MTTCYCPHCESLSCGSTDLEDQLKELHCKHEKPEQDRKIPSVFRMGKKEEENVQVVREQRDEMNIHMGKVHEELDDVNDDIGAQREERGTLDLTSQYYRKPQCSVDKITRMLQKQRNDIGRMLRVAREQRNALDEISRRLQGEQSGLEHREDASGRAWPIMEDADK